MKFERVSIQVDEKMAQLFFTRGEPEISVIRIFEDRRVDLNAHTVPVNCSGSISFSLEGIIGVLVNGEQILSEH